MNIQSAASMSGFVSEKQQKELLDYFAVDDHRVDSRPDVRSKHPRWNLDAWPQQVIKSALDKLLLYEYDVEEIIFNESRISFRLHADTGDGSDQCLQGHAVLIPLLVEGRGATVFFDNHWYDSSTKFSRVPIGDYEYNLPCKNGDWVLVPDLRTLLLQCRSAPDTVHDFTITDEFIQQLEGLIEARSGGAISKRDARCYNYEHISGYKPGQQLAQSVHREYLTHIPIENFEGLTIESIQNWCPGTAIVFPRTQLHCAASGHRRKIGITVFTRQK